MCDRDEVEMVARVDMSAFRDAILDVAREVIESMGYGELYDMRREIKSLRERVTDLENANLRRLKNDD